MHETLRLSTRRRNRPKVSALGRVRLAGLPLDRLCCSSCCSIATWRLSWSRAPGNGPSPGAGRL